MPTRERLVALSTGPVLARAYWLSWRLAARGMTLWRDGEYLMVSPPRLLTAADRVAITAAKPDLLAIVDDEAARVWRV